MPQNPPDPDMLNEYDFSGGLRGRHAARYAERGITMVNHAPPVITMRFTEAEVALIVAALRNWLYDLEGDELEEGQDLEDAFGGHFKVHRMLNEAATEALVARFNFDESQGFVRDY